MHKTNWRRFGAALALVFTLALAACSATGGRQATLAAAEGGGQVVDTPRITIALITHAAPGDTYWDIVRKGAEEAALKDNVELQYLSDPDGGRQSQLVDQAIDQGVDGIAVTLAKADAMAGAMQRATKAGIPMVSLNGGEDKFKALGAFAHFGSNETLAGEAAGAEIKKLGAKHPLCVVHEQGNVGLEARCAGIKKAVPGTELLYVQGTDMTQVQSTVTAKLQSDKTVDLAVGLNAPNTLTILKAKAAAGSEAKVAAFDMNQDLVNAIKNDEVAFTVDQQPWLQGYLAVDSLWQYERGGFQLGGGQPTLTGPAIIDKERAEQISDFAAEGVR